MGYVILLWHSLSLPYNYFGRYANFDREDWICLFCNSNQIENEYHFLLTCRFHRELRKTYLKHYYYQWPNLNKLITNRSIVINLAKHVYFASHYENKSLTISMFSINCLLCDRSNWVKFIRLALKCKLLCVESNNDECSSADISIFTVLTTVYMFCRR